MKRASHRKRARSAASMPTAPIFAALGDDTRLAIVRALSDGPPKSITHLTAGASITRQAITKHLRVLADVGLVRGIRHGRETRFELQAKPINTARRALDTIANQWEDALHRLKMFVERKS